MPLYKKNIYDFWKIKINQTASNQNKVNSFVDTRIKSNLCFSEEDVDVPVAERLEISK